MSESIQLQAVVEAPYYEGKFFCPWEVPFRPLSMIRLWGEMTYPEIGLVFAQLARYNKIKLSSDRRVVLEQIITAKSLVLPGGIQAAQMGQGTISPSCCCGLERWREWINFLETGDSPWLGHNPSPWLEGLGDVVRIWSDGGLEESNRSAFHIDISRSSFEKALILVEQDLQAFLFSIESWAQEIGFGESGKLFQKFDECFDIGRRYRFNQYSKG